MQGALKVSPRLGLGVEGASFQENLDSAEGGGGLHEARESENSDIRSIQE